jgi:hypothetical protein
MNDGRVKIGDAFYVPLRTARAMTGYGASNIHRLWEKGQIKRIKRGLGPTHLYKLEDVEKFMGSVEDDDEI